MQFLKYLQFLKKNCKKFKSKLPIINVGTKFRKMFRKYMVIKEKLFLIRFHQMVLIEKN